MYGSTTVHTNRLYEASYADKFYRHVTHTSLFDPFRPDPIRRCYSSTELSLVKLPPRNQIATSYVRRASSTLHRTM